MPGKSVEDRLLTAEELVKVKGRCELVEGKVVRLSPAGRRHGEVTSNIHALLLGHVSRKRLGRVLSAYTGYRLRRDPDTVRAPDVAFVSKATLARPEAPGEAFFATAPDLAVEVLSPDDSWVKVEKKVREYLAAGGALVWVVNPESETVHVYPRSGDARVLTAEDRIDGGKVLPGFRVAVRSFFAR